MNRRKIVSLITSLCFLLTMSIVVNSYAIETQTEIFKEDFENGLKGWQQEGSNIEIVTSTTSGKYLKISRDNRRGFTYVSREFNGYSGTLRFEAMVKAENVITGTEKFRDNGKFQAAIIVNGKETDWPSADFEGSFEWSPRRFEVFDLSGNEKVVLRIGLQNAKGTISVDNIKVIHIPGDSKK